MIHDVTPLDVFTNTDTLLNQQDYGDLVGTSIRRTPNEQRSEEEEQFLEVLKTHTLAGDPILSTEIDLRRLLFTN